LVKVIGDCSIRKGKHSILAKLQDMNWNEKEMITSNFKRDGGLPIGLSKSFKVEKEEGPKVLTFNQQSCFVFDSFYFFSILLLCQPYLTLLNALHLLSRLNPTFFFRRVNL